MNTRRADPADPVPRGRAPLALDRATLATAIDRSGLGRVAFSLRRAPRLTVLTYHRVADPADSPVLDEGVVDSTPDQFARQMAFVKRRFDVVTIGDVRAFVAGRAALPHRPLLVSFDDGYRDNHDVALPILLDCGIRATFFVATHYIEARRLYWWDRVAWLVGRSRGERLRLTYPREEILPLDGLPARRRAIRRVQRIIKDERGLDLARFLDGVEAAAGVSVPSGEERRLADALVMTWEHVAALRRAGMDVQSHTHTHRVLQTLEPEELDRELRTSRAAIERAIGAPVFAVSYPVGKSLGKSPDILRAVRAAGYELGFSNATGINRIGSFDPLDAGRLSMDRSVSDSFFRAMLAFPWLAH